MDFIVRQKNFWAEDDDSVLRAIHEGFVHTHQAMWKELGQFNLYVHIPFTWSTLLKSYRPTLALFMTI